MKKLKELDITQEALLKLIQIIKFLKKKHREEFVQFIGVELGEKVIAEYLKYAESHKNPIYLSTSIVTVCEGDKWLDGQRDHVRT